MPPVRPVLPTLAALSLLFVSPARAADLDAKRRSLEKRVEGLAIAEPLAALATSGGLVLMDVSDPGQPRRLGALSLTGGSGAVAIEGSRALLACGAEGLIVVDASEPGKPVRVGGLDTDGGVIDVLPVSEGRALLADGTMGVKLADLSDPARPAVLASLDTGGYARKLEIHPVGALVAAGYSGLLVLGLSEEGTPSILGRMDSRNARGVAASADGGRAYIADGEGGLVVADLTRPESPREVARLRLEPGEARDVVVLDEGVLAVAMGRGGVRTVEVRRDRIRELARLPLTRPAVELAAAGDRLFVANDSGGLAVVDVSKHDKPRLLSERPER